MAAVGNADVIALELEKVIDKLRVLYETDDKFHSHIDKQDVEKISNRQMRIPLEMAPGGSFQYFNADGGDLGRGSGPAFDKAVVSCVFMSENIEYTKLAEWGTNDNRKAIISAVRRLTARAFLELRRQLDAQLMSGGAGQVGIVTSVSTAAGVDTYTCTSDGFGVRLVRQQQNIQVYDTTLSILRGQGTITSWDVVNKQIQVTPSISGVIATDILVVAGITAPTSLPAIYGIPYHHSNASVGTWLGFDRATLPMVRASRVNGNASALVLPLPRLAINLIGNRVGIDNDHRPEAWMHPCQKQAYEMIGQLVSIITKSAKDEGLDMYFDRMQMAGAPIKESYNWDMTRIDFVCKDVWGRGEILPLGFYTTDGRKIFELRGPSGGVATAEIFYLVNGVQYFVNNPAACAYIDNLAIPAGY